MKFFAIGLSGTKGLLTRRDFCCPARLLAETQGASAHQTVRPDYKWRMKMKCFDDCPFRQIIDEGWYEKERHYEWCDRLQEKITEERECDIEVNE